MTKLSKIQEKLMTESGQFAPIIKEVAKENQYPIYIYDLSKLVSNYDYVQLAYDYKEKFPASRQSSIKGWHTNYNAHENFQDSRLDRLISIIEKRTEEIINIGHNNNVRAKVYSVWYNILNKGDKIIAHKHIFPGYDHCTQYSAVYYAQTTDEMSPIIFENKINLIPKNNNLLIFPSHLMHEVSELKTSQDRITIAANISLQGNQELTKDKI
jgi:hypothetical protein